MSTRLSAPVMRPAARCPQTRRTARHAPGELGVTICKNALLTEGACTVLYRAQVYLLLSTAGSNTCKQPRQGSMPAAAVCCVAALCSQDRLHPAAGGPRCLCHTTTPLKGAPRGALVNMEQPALSWLPAWHSWFAISNEHATCAVHVPVWHCHAWCTEAPRHLC